MWWWLKRKHKLVTEWPTRAKPLDPYRKRPPWAYFPKSNITGTRAFFTHGYMTLPFMVVLTSTTFSVYMRRTFALGKYDYKTVRNGTVAVNVNSKKQARAYPVLVVPPTPYKAVFVGRDSIRPYHEGHTVLIQLLSNTTKNKYMFINDAVSTFELDDTIVGYMSPYEENENPAMYAVGLKNVYFLETLPWRPNTFIAYLPRSELNATKYDDPFQQWLRTRQKQAYQVPTPRRIVKSDTRQPA